ncbi:MAG TPA: CdaR family protein [Spirochaetota bacterium]|nr:CdaR family protein [Spirochaetota bacterium]HPJ36822.1 CdaR family protein [Spirochaetota bacterium]HPQ53316.1 CdaR family protein [Spirochaetota bacterium]
MKGIFNEIKSLIFSRELVPKLVAIILSVILWAYIGSTKIGEVAFRIPVEFKSLSEDLIISNYSIKNVTIKLSGKKEDLNNFNIKNVKAYVSLKKAVPGENQKFPINVAKEDVPEGVNIELIRNNVEISIEKRIVSPVRIIPVIAGELKDGYIMGDVLVSPEYVNISGQADIISKIKNLKTKIVSIEDATRDVEQNVEVDIADYSGVAIDPTVVSVTVPIVDTLRLKVIDRQIDVRKENPRFGYELNTSRVKVFIRVPKDGSVLNEDSVDVFVDGSTVNPEKIFKETKKNYTLQEFPVRVVLGTRSQDAAVLKVIPKKVTMKIYKK